MQDYPAAPLPTRRLPDFKLWILALLVLFSLGFRLGAMPLQSPDEGRYSESAREMLETGDWLIPHFGYVERVNKPPLFYWAAAASMRLLGVNETAARLPSLLAALAIALILYLMARKAWDEDTAKASALVLLTSLLFAALARTAITDMLLCLWLTASAAAFWWAARDRSAIATLLFFAAAGAGTMTKGPVAIALPGLIGVLYLTLTRQWRQVRWGAVAAGIVLYGALAVPWYAAMQARYPSFLHYFFVGENLQRFAGNEHPEPLWFYVPIVVVGFGVWIPSLLTSIVAAGRSLRDLPKSDPATLYALLWAGVIFAFFSASKGKLPTYILPCFPPLALLIGRRWARREDTESELKAKSNSWTRWHAGLAAVGLAAVAGAVYVLVPRLTNVPPGAQMEAVILLGMGALAAAYVTFRGNACSRFGGIAAAGALLTLGGSSAASLLLNDTWACRSVAQTIVTKVPAQARLYTYKEDGLTALRFYLGQSLGSSQRLQDIPPLERPLIEDGGSQQPSQNEGRAGRRLRRKVADRGTSAALSAALNEPGPVLFLMREDDYERVRPILASADAEQFDSRAGRYVLLGRLTAMPRSGIVH